MTKADELIGRLEQATGPDRELAADICEAVGFKVRRHSTTRFGRRAAAWAYLAPDRRWHAVDLIMSSVDAALCFMQGVLEDSAYSLVNDYGGYNRADINIAPGCEGYPSGGVTLKGGVADTMPLAIVLATLKARSLQSKGLTE